MLFRLEDLVVRSDVENIVDVVFRTTAEQALRNLALAGLGWHAAVAAYADTRAGAFSEGMFLGYHQFHPSEDRDLLRAEREFEAFERLPAEQDLTNIGQLSVDEWQDDAVDELTLLSALSYSGDLPSPLEAASSTQSAARGRNIANPFAAARAAERLPTSTGSPRSWRGP